MEYTYKVFVKDEQWAQGGRWDWSARDKALVQTGRQYDNRFRTHPDPIVPSRSLTFAAIGDFGVGVKTDSRNRRQQQIADALTHAVDTEDVRLVITTGDNIYAGSKLFGVPIGATGDEDDDWFFTCHFLLARIDDDRMSIRAIGERASPAEPLTDIVRWTPDGTVVSGPIDIRRS
jgi:hypothetical protein